MVDIANILSTNTLWVLVSIVLSAIPLYIVVKLVKGETGFVKVILIGLILSLASAGAYNFIGMFAGIAMLIFTLFAYKIAFKITLMKAFIVWILQYVFVAVAIVFMVYFAALL